VVGQVSWKDNPDLNDSEFRLGRPPAENSGQAEVFPVHPGGGLACRNLSPMANPQVSDFKPKAVLASASRSHAILNWIARIRGQKWLIMNGADARPTL
jgi:hypothetical protein